MNHSSASVPVVSDIAQRVAHHAFAPVHNGFTVDPETGNDGVADLQSTDGRVRTLAVRDLIRHGQGGQVANVIGLLRHDSMHVRQVAAMTLGLLRAESAIAPLSKRLADMDEDPVVRSQAAIALGQIGGGAEVLAAQEETAEQPDVRHQCEVALDRIRKQKPVEPAAAEQIAALDSEAFGRVQVGEPAPNFTLNDTEGTAWSLSDLRGEKTVVLLWVFADWCPVCHKEFHALIRREAQFREFDVAVATLECHDRYRGRVMTGQELRPSYWFADKLPGGHPLDAYPDGIWWPHLLDQGATVGARYGIDPWQFAVHSEYVNRPATVIIDTEGVVQLAYFGTYWGDRPTIGQVLNMIETDTYTFNAPPPRKGPH
ncbi:hypothetical protein CRI93_13530 [Longimonas halophila]|uniref:Thioredoxin domain-containing protein n=1 Tax=Longimonas halophila TaxID=1469170 RepID=A0A2H3NLD5_9BACT|nr:redoxin domain-containing protein [Longimonas halophila]PEN05227.1 hypothetical protein CRI93_13530 [Longimonas halophila]